MRKVNVFADGTCRPYYVGPGTTFADMATFAAGWMVDANADGVEITDPWGNVLHPVKGPPRVGAWDRISAVHVRNVKPTQQ